MTEEEEEFVRRSQELAEQVRPELERIKKMFAGKGCQAQGAALADLVSIWLVGQRPEDREDGFVLWASTVWRLVPVNEKLMGDPWKRLRRKG